MDGKCERCGADLLEDNTCPVCGPEGYDQMDQEDMDLLKTLKDRIKGLEQEVQEDLGSGLDDMERRVDGVVQSVKRIENLDSESDPLASLDEEDRETIPEVTEVTTAGPGLDEQFQVSTDSPYETSRSSDEAFDLTSYGMGLDGILTNLVKLIRIKREKDNISEAWNLVSVALEISPEDAGLQEEIELLEGISEEKSRGRTRIEPAIHVEGRTTVLVPELEDEIVRLEARAEIAIEQMEKLMGSGSLPKGKMERFVSHLGEARSLMGQKMFTKAEDVALRSINDLKAMIKENMDNQIQENLDRAREMVESLERGEGNLDAGFVESVRERFDIALRSYLIDEFERANLLAMEVIRKVMEMTHPESTSIRNEILDLRRSLKGKRDQPHLMNRILDIEDLLKRSEDLLNRRELEDSSRILEKARLMLNDLESVEKLQSQSTEVQIRLANRVQRIANDPDYADSMKKMDYLASLMEKERFEDVIIIGKDIESELDSIDNMKRDRECKEMINRIEDLLVHVEEMESPQELKHDFDELKRTYMDGDLTTSRHRAKELLDKVQLNMKILSITRARRICDAIMESRSLISELRYLNLDTTDPERKIRMARNLIKDENYLDGLKHMDSINEELRDRLSKARGDLKGFADIHRDSMEAIMERYRDDPLIILMRKKHLPLLKRYITMGNYRKAVEMYEKLADRLDSIIVREEIRKRIENDLTKGRFEIYKKKDEGFDIAEPLSIFTQAQKRFQEGKVIPAEYYLEVSMKYCDTVFT